MNTLNSSVALQWILENFEVSKDEGLKRTLIYNFYELYCNKLQLPLINPSTFGKCIHSLFKNIKTKRLGARGCTQYYYDGIKIKTNSYLLCKLDDNINFNDGKIGANFNLPKPPQFFMPSFESDLIKSSNNCDIVQKFIILYQDYTKIQYAYLTQLKVEDTYSVWRKFWNCEEDKKSQDLSIQNCIDSMLNCPPLFDYIQLLDYTLYHCLISYWTKNVKLLSNEINQEIRKFAKQSCKIMKNILKEYPPNFISVKLILLNALCQILKKFTLVNYLTQATRPILNDKNQLKLMMDEINKLDIPAFKKQVCWTLECNPQTLNDYFNQFTKNLINSPQLKINDWMSWLNNIVTTTKSLDPQDLKHNLKTLLLKWSYVSSTLLRDLTLKSSKSFNSFHLLRMLFDEYLSYQIQNELATLNGYTLLQYNLYTYTEGDIQFSKKILKPVKGTIISDV